MTDVKRYDFDPGIGNYDEGYPASMLPDDAGEYVRYDDYAALESILAIDRRNNTTLTSLLDEAKKELEYFQPAFEATNEELVKTARELDETKSQIDLVLKLVARETERGASDAHGGGVVWMCEKIQALLVEKQRCLSCGGPTPCYHDNDTDDHKRAAS
jgi:hypothetical protein